MVKQDTTVSLGVGKFTNSGNTRTAGLEQYYTPEDLAERLTQTFVDVVSADVRSDTFIEPAAGTGSFVEALKSLGAANILAYDIAPKHPDVEEANFLDLLLEDTGMLCVTNPPFGRNNSLSAPFFNKLARHCSHIGFIIPKSWRKWTVQDRLDRRAQLVYDEDVAVHYVDDNGENLYDSKKPGVNTVFQIWRIRSDGYRREKVVVPDHGLIVPTTPAEADVALIVFGHSCGKVFEDFDRSKKKTTTMYLKVSDPSVIDVLKSLPYDEFGENVSFVKALSIHEIRFLLNRELGLQNPKIESII